MTYTYYTCMTYIDKHVMYEIATHMSHICGIYAAYMGSMYDMLYDNLYSPRVVAEKKN